MRYSEQKKAVLLLQDGTAFYGRSAGFAATATGEICFNTGMTGYQEIFTDPSYYGQLVVATHVHIGNYGVSEVDTESNQMKIAGLVCKSFSSFYSRQQAEDSLLPYFQLAGIPAVSDIDTRAVVRYIRDKGAMNAILSSETTDLQELAARLQEVPSMEGLELSSLVSTPVAYTKGENQDGFRVALLDLGVKRNIIKCLTDRGCFVKVFPAKTSFSEMQEFKPNGYLFSNGPGDPAAMGYAVDTMKEVLDKKIPLFGICLGHQMLAKASGVSTYKMFNGHRGINHPVKNLLTGKGEITSQNHGFAVNEKEIRANEDITVTHVHLNDATIAGIALKSRPAFSVQYHPESAPGPHDSRYLFDQFIDSMQLAGA